MPNSNSPILDAVIAKNQQTIHEVVALRSATFAETNAYTAPAAPLSAMAAKIQLAKFNGEIGQSEGRLAEILLNETIPSIKLNSSLKGLQVGVVVVAVPMPEGIEDKRDFVGQSLMYVGRGTSSKGFAWRKADGTKVYMTPTKELVRPASEAEAIAVADGLLQVRTTLTVKLFSDKSADLGDDE